MAFESLSNKLTAAFKHIVGKDRLSEKNMQAMLNEIRIALLEADVNYGVVKQFLADVKEKMIGVQVQENLDPSQQVYKIVRDEITTLLAGDNQELKFSASGLTTIMMVGLQGTGKTTSAAKIAKILKEKQNRKPLLIAADIIRPAAIDQLQQLANSINVECFANKEENNVLNIINDGIDYAKKNDFDTIIIDTAGRLAIDKKLMEELSDIKKKFKPDEILLTVDALTGQDIVNVAKTFNDLLEITGLVVTKFDGDARGGGVLSVRSVSNVAVKFVGVGEKIDDIDIFYPDRLASRILGMGDIESLVEKAQQVIDEKEAEEAMAHLMDGSFSLQDMLSQLKSLKKMGSLSSLMGMLPGMGELTKQINDADAEKSLKVYEAIINSMTPYERKHPDELRNSHKNRIASGSGTSVSDVNKLLNSFDRTKRMMNQMGIGRFKRF